MRHSLFGSSLQQAHHVTLLNVQSMHPLQWRTQPLDQHVAFSKQLLRTCFIQHDFGFNGFLNGQAMRDGMLLRNKPLNVAESGRCVAKTK